MPNEPPFKIPAHSPRTASGETKPKRRSPDEVFDACVFDVFGVRLETTSEPVPGPHILRRSTGYDGDRWQGGTSETERSVVGLRSPDAVTLVLGYSVHELSGQVDTWHVVLGGVNAAQQAALVEALAPYRSVFNLANHARCGWKRVGDRGWTGWGRRGPVTG